MASLVLSIMTSAQHHLSHPKYRPDIDGLRAIAVLSVVVFHAFPGLMKGGFIGVDVFFVISGYLISTIIFENLDKGTFSFTEFYARRIKRIFPALLLVLIASYTFAWFALFADEYKQLGKHIAAGAGFVSNFVLWGETGYFDTSAETKPLLHLWSLGIEEQFYIVWPFLLWLSWKRKFNLFIVTIIVALISFVLNIKGVKTDFVAAFFSPQTRFWELLSGSLLAWITLYKNGACHSVKLKVDKWLVAAIYRNKIKSDGKTSSNVLSFIGLFLLAYGFLLINKNFTFPGIWAVIPVLGAVMIIAAGSKTWINRKILSHKVAVWIGLISYPLYLWHWPLLSFARIVESGLPDVNIRLLAVVLSIFLAWFTYVVVERPIRLGKHGKTKVTFLVLLMIIIGSVGYYTYHKDGLGFRTQDREDFIDYFENSYPDRRYFKKINLSVEWRSECAFFNGKKYLKQGYLEGGVTHSKPVEQIDSSCYERDFSFDKSVLIWGDSYAQTLSSGIVAFVPKNWQVLQIASSACKPNPNIDSPSSQSQCNQSNYFAIKTIRDAVPNVVVIAQAKEHSAKAMAEIAYKLQKFGVEKILFLGPTPKWDSHLPKIIARKLWVTKPPMRTYVGINQEIIKSNEQLLREFSKDNSAEYIDVIGFFCNNEGCLTYTGDDIKESITTWDYGHLTPAASKYFAQHFLVERIISK